MFLLPQFKTLKMLYAMRYVISVGKVTPREVTSMLIHRSQFKPDISLPTNTAENLNFL